MFEQIITNARLYPRQMWAQAARDAWWGFVLVAGAVLDGIVKTVRVSREIDRRAFLVLCFVCSAKMRREMVRDAGKRVRKNIRAKA